MKYTDIALMGNHIHSLMKEGKEDLGIIFRRIGASFVYWYNWKYNRLAIYFKIDLKVEQWKQLNIF